MRPADLTERDGLLRRDVPRSPVDSRPHDLDGRGAAEGPLQSEEIDRIGTQGDEHLEAGRLANGVRHRERLCVRSVVVLRAKNRDLVIG